MASKASSNYSTFVKSVLRDSEEFNFEVLESKIVGKFYLISKGDRISIITEESVVNEKLGSLKDTLDYQLNQVDDSGNRKSYTWYNQMKSGWIVYFQDGFRPPEWNGSNVKVYDSIESAIFEINAIRKNKCRYNIYTELASIEVLD